MVVQTHVKRNRVDVAGLKQKRMAMHRMTLDDREFSVGQLARFVQNLARQQHLANVMQQAGHAG